MNKIQNIIDYLIREAVGRYQNNIALIATYGSFFLGTQTEYSDLDMYAVIDDNTIPAPNWEFVFNDQPVSLISQSWEDIENKVTIMAGGMWCVTAGQIGCSKILYSRSQDDLKRFRNIQNLISEDVDAKLQEAVSIFHQANGAIARIQLAAQRSDLLAARWSVWGLVNFSVQILSLLNNKYYARNWGNNVHEALKLDIIPFNLRENIESLISSSDYYEMVESGLTLIEGLRLLLMEHVNNGEFDGSSLIDEIAGRFPHILEYLNKIRSAATKKDIFAASYAASELQVWVASELLQAQNHKKIDYIGGMERYAEYGSAYEELGFPNLANAITEKDFSKLISLTNELEIKILNYIRGKGKPVPKFASFEELSEFLDTRIKKVLE
jgi:hypothetical protein